MRAALAGALLAVALPASAQPRLVNARLTEHTVTASLDATFRQLASAIVEPAWIAYSAPVENPEAQMCCFGGDWYEGKTVAGRCTLEPGTGSSVIARNARDIVRLEAESFFIFYRVEDRRVTRVRMFSEDCGIDAVGRAVHWLSGVRPAESVAFLAALARSEDAETRVTNGAVAALAHHGGPGAVAPLVRLAREAPRGKVRGEALFWLAQRAGSQALRAITDAIEHDPETEVKRRAVFALSQLPANEGVPKLIEVARNHRNPAVRKQAFFWLGQSKDPRALAFFEEILGVRPRM